MGETGKCIGLHTKIPGALTSDYQKKNFNLKSLHLHEFLSNANNLHAKLTIYLE